MGRERRAARKPRRHAPPKPLGATATWTAGEPNLINVTNEILVKGDAPDWWGDIESIKVGNTKNRYVKSIEIREINDVLDSEDGGEGRKTVSGRFVVHHMIWSTRVINADGSFGESTNWPVHEVGRNADVFDPEGARLLPANSSIVSNSVHLHSNGRDTKARLEIGWRFQRLLRSAYPDKLSSPIIRISKAWTALEEA